MDEKEHYLSLIKELYSRAKACLEQRLSHIGCNANLFELKECVKKNGEPFLDVLYDSSKYLSIIPYRKNYITIDGKVRCQGYISVIADDDSAWYNEKYHAVQVFVDENFVWEINHKGYDVKDFLDKFLPISDVQIEEKIKSDLKALNITIDKVDFDTMNQRYVINLDLEKYFSLRKPQDNSTLYLCKYMSLDTFLCIVKSKMIRLNSVVSMNDSSESFFLGDYLGNAYDDVRRKNTDEEFYREYPDALRYSKLIERKSILIMSLTDRMDDSMMWRLYGDNGRGVCLCFKVPSNLVKPIFYISENDQKLKALKVTIDKWRTQNINVIFTDLEKYMFITKSPQFEYEKEYRLLKKEEVGKLEIAKYGGLISYYRDYNFQELGIEPESLYIGSNLPYRDVNYPLLVDMAKRLLGVSYVNYSHVDQLRV